MDGSTAQGHAGGQGGFEPTPQIIDMASTEELVEAIYRPIASRPTPIPVTLMNDGVDETAAIIGVVVCESAFEFDPPLSDNSKSCRADRHSDPTPNDKPELGASGWGQSLIGISASNRLLKKSPRLRDQIIGRGFFHSWLGCAADS